MNVDGYQFDRDALALLLTRTYFPERDKYESELIRDWLTARGAAYTRYAFSVRVGQGQAPNPEHLEGVQRNTRFSTMKRIDVLAWQGEQPTIFEVKLRVGPGTLGQLQTYRLLFLEKYPDALPPFLAAIGRSSDPDTARVLQAHGVTLYLYPREGESSGLEGA